MMGSGFIVHHSGDLGRYMSCLNTGKCGSLVQDIPERRTLSHESQLWMVHGIGCTSCVLSDWTKCLPFRKEMARSKMWDAWGDDFCEAYCSACPNHKVFSPPNEVLQTCSESRLMVEKKKQRTWMDMDVQIG